jgi:hypothetical protein
MRLGQRQPQQHRAHTPQEENTDNHDHRWSGLLSSVGFLSNNLFFQLIRESPIHMVRNKSMPAVYLTPGMIGCLLALQQQPPKAASSENEQKGGGSNHRKSSDNEPKRVVKEVLKREFGIKSNHIGDTQWTGISLARWMDLVILDTTRNSSSDDFPIEVCQQSLVSALWLMALWGLAPSKETLLDYYEALEKAGISCSSSPHPGPESTVGFTENDFAPEKLNAAMNRLLEHYSSSESESAGDNEGGLAAARALELVCAAIVLQQQQGVSSLPPVVPNGYFAFDGGDTKADCAEVVVREILTLLLWDSTEGTMDVSRLPSTSSRELRAVLRRLDEQKENQDTERRKEQQEELGQAWFDLLSDLPHCEYLAKSPNGRAFELAPTSESISGALWHLLVGKDEHDASEGNQPWTSLHELASFWSDLRQEPKVLIVRHDRLKHQSHEGGSTIMEHELLSLHLRDNSRAIELRLRCDFQKASGMAAVTHLTKPRQKRLLDPDQVKELQELCFRRVGNRGEPEENSRDAMVRPRCDPSLVMLCLALQSEHEGPLSTCWEECDDVSIAFESLLWLATPYGPDRRELQSIGDGDTVGDESGYDRQILAQSRLLLKERILHACRICKTHPCSGAQLLSWILQESPVVIETSASSFSGNIQEIDPDNVAIEQALLSLPTYVLDDDFVLEAIEWNWVCIRRGRVLTRAIRWKLGKLSAWEVFAGTSFHELPEVLSLSRSIERMEGTNDIPY